ncbi:hypothetical protein KFK09_009732 [Dendrobium nobile]|uniref:RING-type E3 ubiquitin transferase n=1 Tax=Dendrobium nobile TaxID=94219 RepID=A0A8T3BK47_DENNO|nr:hypothetical protein KFK09_009732 [Dendrobium nobile]
MATLEELLAEDGFNGRRHKTKPWPRRGSSGSSGSSSPNPRFGFSGPILPLARTSSDVNPRRSVSLIPERGRITDSKPNNARGRRYEEQPPDALEPKAFTSPNKGGSIRNQLENFKSKRFMGWKDGSAEEIKGKWGYDRSHKNYLFEHEQPVSSQIPNLQVRSKDGSPELALDDAVLKEITSILSSCVDRLLKDESFRSSIHQVCFTSLNSSKVETRQAKDNDVLSSLKEAIKTVETMIIEGPNQLALKKASLKLSVITGLKSMESDGGCTCGIPNSHLAGWAHFYLSILYKIQKKDKVSAKHLLLVFCDIPHQARTKLLPGLWKHLFLPPLSHLKAWYDKVKKSIQGTSEVTMNLEFLDKVYNDLLDVSTSQFAAYYKGWLMDDNSPALPSILVPVSFPEIAEDANDVISVESFSSNTSALSKTMISKRLYESVFGEANRMEITEVMESGDEEENDDVEDDTEEGQSEAWARRYDDSEQSDGETGNHSPNLGTYAAERFGEYYSAGSQYSVVPFQKNDQENGRSCGSSSLNIIEADKTRVESKIFQPCHTIKGYVQVGKSDQQENDNEPKMKMLTQAAFQLQLTDLTQTESVIYEADTILKLSGLCSTQASPRAVLFGSHQDTDQDSLFTRIPKDFICPLTGLLLTEPVTLESGYTCELAAIKKRFDQGNKTCPVTGKSLKYSAIPETNAVLKHMINDWVAECFRNSPSNKNKQAWNSKIELALSIFEQMTVGFSSKDKKENIKHLISLGGFHFLTQTFELGSFEEKSRAAELLVQCIQADGCYRNYLVMHISKPSLLELIHSGQVHAITNAASLLIELICLNRRMDITSFLSGLKTEASDTIMSDLLLCLKSSPPEERVLVAVLLLHLDLMEDSQVYSVFRREAVKCVITTLECCLSNKKFIANCRTALLILGGIFSVSGEILTEIWLLKQAGLNDEDDETISEEEERRREEWLKSMVSIFIGYKKKSFLETLSNCWKLGSPDLARICLVTTAWISHALPSLFVPELQFSSMALLLRLKESLSSDMDIQQRVLACLCLLNFSKISECRASLKAFAEEIHEPLEVTWTAKHLYNEIVEEASAL